VSRVRPMRDLGLAATLLTVVPLRVSASKDEPSMVAGWFPVVGLAVGALGWALVRGAEALGWHGQAALLMAVLVVALWALMTRFLHWDGLADVADGLWGGHTPERRLEIMADSATGAFGSTAIVLTALVEVAAVSAIVSAGHARPLIIVPAIARLAPAFAAWLGKPARAGGLGRSVMARPTVAAVLPAVAVVAACGWVMILGYGPGGAALVGAGVVLAATIPHLLSQPVGGVTGDIMGASTLICEALLLAVAAIAWGA